MTREQAVNGMVLDEILSDHGTADNELALELAALRVADLGLDHRLGMTARPGADRATSDPTPSLQR
ncbi:hypothetical protein [Nocardia sp. NPDC004860]|uniref:hypothetical protein n=1 Tax=Nocardia sp. NPDC004860 TaxID=3154557 RepID=UPI00339F58BF